jgi:hypothetical protein
MVLQSAEKVDSEAEAKKKKAELKKQIAAAYKDPFYQNSFKYLNNPNYKGYNLGEGLKGVSLGDYGTLDLGGQYRLRHHSERNFRNINANPGTRIAGLTGRSDDFLLDRTRLYANYQASERVRIYSEFLHAKSHFENFAPRSIEENDFDLQNLFADVVLLDTDAGKLSGRYGRQELLFGQQRLLSPLDWANTRRSFEGGRLTWDNENATTDFLLMRSIALRADAYDKPNQNEALWGVYRSDKTFNNPIDTYYLGYENAVSHQQIHTLGVLLKGEDGDLLWDNEFGYQFGRNSNASSLCEYSLTFGLGRRLSSSDKKPTIWAYYDWASGGDTAGEGWNHLFPLGHRYNGFMDLFGRKNLHDINFLFTLDATEKLNLLAWYHYFRLENGAQGPYGLNLAAFNPGGTVGSRDLGHEIDLMATYKLNPRSSMLLGFSHFFAGKYYETSTNASGDALFANDASFFYTQWHYNF